MFQKYSNIQHYLHWQHLSEVLQLISRFMRSSVLDVLGADYILLAKAKGCSKFQIVKRHVMRNALTPIISIVAPQVAGIVTGSFVIERIFTNSRTWTLLRRNCKRKRLPDDSCDNIIFLNDLYCVYGRNGYSVCSS